MRIVVVLLMFFATVVLAQGNDEIRLKELEIEKLKLELEKERLLQQRAQNQQPVVNDLFIEEPIPPSNDYPHTYNAPQTTTDKLYIKFDMPVASSGTFRSEYTIRIGYDTESGSYTESVKLSGSNIAVGIRANDGWLEIAKTRKKYGNEGQNFDGWAIGGLIPLAHQEDSTEVYLRGGIGKQTTNVDYIGDVTGTTFLAGFEAHSKIASHLRLIGALEWEYTKFEKIKFNSEFISASEDSSINAFSLRIGLAASF